MGMEGWDRALRCYWLEPRFVATVEWHREYGLGAQLFARISRADAEQFVAGGGWRDPDRKITFVEHEEPDWDWWEPRHDQPWRRIQARERAFDGRL